MDASLVRLQKRCYTSFTPSCVLFAAYHFPDAFYGQNTKIRETLSNLILKVRAAC